MKKAEEWAEKILFSYCDARGIFKRTYADRFDQFDDMAIDCLGREFPASRALTMHDIGVSDGRTACDFFQKLAPRFPHLSYYASDYEPSLMMVRSGKGGSVVTLNKKGEAIEIVMPPFVFNLIKPENFLFYPINYAARSSHYPWSCSARQRETLPQATVDSVCWSMISCSLTPCRVEWMSCGL